MINHESSFIYIQIRGHNVVLNIELTGNQVFIYKCCMDKTFISTQFTLIVFLVALIL